jgi:hypothetical protein
METHSQAGGCLSPKQGVSSMSVVGLQNLGNDTCVFLNRSVFRDFPMRISPQWTEHVRNNYFLYFEACRSIRNVLKQFYKNGNHQAASCAIGPDLEADRLGFKLMLQHNHSSLKTVICF